MKLKNIYVGLEVKDKETGERFKVRSKDCVECYSCGQVSVFIINSMDTTYRFPDEIKFVNKKRDKL